DHGSEQPAQPPVASLHNLQRVRQALELLHDLLHDLRVLDVALLQQANALGEIVESQVSAAALRLRHTPALLEQPAGAFDDFRRPSSELDPGYGLDEDCEPGCSHR